MNHPPDDHQPPPIQPPGFGSPLTERLWFFMRNLPKKFPPKKDPWTPGDDAAAKHPAAHKICLRCIYPQPPVPQTWFCPNCGEPTGDCVNSMHYLYIFSMGALARRGVMGKPEKGLKGFLEDLFLLIFFTHAYQIIFAPLYWFWMIRKANGHPICDDTPPALVISDDDNNTDNDTDPPAPPPANPPHPATPHSRLLLFLMTVFAIVTIALVVSFGLACARAHKQTSTPKRVSINRVILPPDTPQTPSSLRTENPRSHKTGAFPRLSSPSKASPLTTYKPM